MAVDCLCLEELRVSANICFMFVESVATLLLASNEKLSVIFQSHRCIMFARIALLGFVALASFSFESKGGVHAANESSLSDKGQPICCMKNAYCCLDNRSCCRR